jgi:hypothetical protein
MRRTLLLASLLLTTGLFGANAHAGFIGYTASAGWLFPGVGNEGILQGGGDKPGMVFSNDFSFGGAYCPALGSDNYLCANVLSSAELNGRRLTLRSSAKITRHKATSFAGTVELTYADTRIEICGVTGSVDTPVANDYFYIGLAGTASQSQSDPSLVVQATGVATFQGVNIQCIGDGRPCTPVKVPHAGGDCYTLGLRADARVTNPSGVAPFDMEAIADFADTMELLAIEGRDENDQPIPGLQYSIVDSSGTPIVTFPNTPETTTTSPATTTTTAPASTTTTVPAGGPTATTTTTLPAGCATDASYQSVTCRLDALIGVVSASAGALAPKLSAKLAAAHTAVDRAQQSVGLHHGKVSKKSLRKASKALAAYRTVLHSKKAAKTLPEPSRDELGAQLSGLQSDLHALITSAH